MGSVEALILGLVQGCTEFLPVSSSGHLAIFEHFLKISNDGIGFSVAVHLGTLFSVFTIYRKVLLDIFIKGIDALKIKSVNSSIKIIYYVFISSIPTGLIGYFFRGFWKQLFSNMSVIGLALIFTGTVLFLTKKMGQGKAELEDPSIDSVSQLNVTKALLLGFAQSFAITPGISRSGITISAGLFLGLDRQFSALYSFLLAIPAILGAALLEFSAISWNSDEFWIMAVGFAGAYLSGLVGLVLILKMVKQSRLEFFSPYLWLLGLALVVESILF